MSGNSIGLVGFFVFILLLALAKPRYVPGRAFSLFRAMFPSWRFFETICHVPQLSYRVLAADGSLTDTPWIAAFPKIPRAAIGLFLNAKVNLRYAEIALLHQLAQDIELLNESEALNFDKSVSYQLVRRLVLAIAAERGEPLKGKQFQFRVLSVLQGTKEADSDAILISKVEQA